MNGKYKYLPKWHENHLAFNRTTRLSVNIQHQYLCVIIMPSTETYYTLQ